MELASAWAKWRQGEQHRHLFEALEREYGETAGDPAVPVTREDGWTEYRRRDLPAPPEAVSLALGDCVQAYRSALEHAVYAVSKAQHPSFEGTEFPLTLTSEEFGKRRKKLRYLPPAHQEFVERLQPYNVSPKTPQLGLYELHDLARIDRHRTIPLTTAVIFAQSVATVTRMTDEVQRSEVEWVLDDRGVVPGGVLLRVGPPAHPAMQSRPQWDVIVALPETGQWIQPMLSATGAIVAAIIGELETDDPTWPPRRDYRERHYTVEPPSPAV